MSDPRRPAAGLAAAVSLSLLACNLTTQFIDPNAASTSIAGTVAAGQTATAAVLAAAGTLAEDLIPTATATPEFTSTPTLTATPSSTPTATPTATLSIPLGLLTQNTNCRSGPLAVYDLIRTFLLGDTVQIVGRNAEGDYFFVTDPASPGKDCWLWGRYVEISGDMSQRPVFTPPPTPTPSYIWTGDWKVWTEGNPGTLSLKQNGSSVSGTFASSTALGISGTISEGGRTLSGAVEGTSQAVTFVFRMSTNMNQFSGHYKQGTKTYSWCGARNGAGQPSPCEGP